MAEVIDLEVSPRTARAPVERMVFLCRKCAKTFPDRKFRKRLKAAAKSRAWGRVRVMETGCFDLCPKRRQVVASAGLLAAGRLMVVQAGTAAETVLKALFGEPGLGRRGSVFYGKELEARRPGVLEHQPGPDDRRGGAQTDPADEDQGT